MFPERVVEPLDVVEGIGSGPLESELLLTLLLQALDRPTRPKLKAAAQRALAAFLAWYRIQASDRSSA